MAFAHAILEFANITQEIGLRVRADIFTTEQAHVHACEERRSDGSLLQSALVSTLYLLKFIVQFIVLDTEGVRLDFSRERKSGCDPPTCSLYVRF